VWRPAGSALVTGTFARWITKLQERRGALASRYEPGSRFLRQSCLLEFGPGEMGPDFRFPEAISAPFAGGLGRRSDATDRLRRGSKPSLTGSGGSRTFDASPDQIGSLASFCPS
jgi:hypothetical protein